MSAAEKVAHQRLIVLIIADKTPAEDRGDRFERAEVLFCEDRFAACPRPISK